jgi:LysM repeat protein
MKMTPSLLITFGALVLLAGCQTARQREAEAQRQAWEESFSRRVLNIENRIFDLENSLALLRREQNAIDNRLAKILSSSTTVGAAQRAEIEGLKKELEETRGANEKKMAIILEEIARENERILKSIREGRGTAAYAQGYEHVVRSGETVSTIARQYGVTVEAIVQANGLADPNSIRVGQILFVPQ